MSFRMYCSICYTKLRQGRDLFITCADCEDHFHYGCLQSDVLGVFFEAMVEQVHWYCRNCITDSHSTRELQELECSVSTDHLRPADIPELEEAAMALEFQDPLMETLDELDGPLMDQNCAANRTEMEVEEEKNTEKEVVQMEGEKEASKEGEPKIKPGNADD